MPRSRCHMWRLQSKLAAAVVAAAGMVLVAGCTSGGVASEVPTESSTTTTPAQVVSQYAAMTDFLNRLAVEGRYTAQYEITDYWGNVVHETVWHDSSGWALQEPDPYVFSPGRELLRAIVRDSKLWLCYQNHGHWSCMPGPSCTVSLECESLRSQAAPLELASILPTSGNYAPVKLYKEGKGLSCLKGTRLYATGTSDPFWDICVNSRGLPIHFYQRGLGTGTDWVGVTLSAVSNRVSSSALIPPVAQFSAPRCRPSNLVATALWGQGQVSQESEVVTFRNVGNTACTLFGYPMARFLEGPANTFGSTSTEESSQPPTVVVLGPGGVASTTVWTSNPLASSTVALTTWGLQVWFSQWSQKLLVRAPIPVAKSPYLGTTPVVAGADQAPL